jgi:hypothetical protein
MHFATRVRTWRVARLYSVQCTVLWNSSISETVRNRAHVHIHFFASTDRYYDLPECWPFLLGHHVYNIRWIRCDSVTKNTGLHFIVIAVLWYWYYVDLIANMGVNNSDCQGECHCYDVRGNYSFLFLISVFNLQTVLIMQWICNYSLCYAVIKNVIHFSDVLTSLLVESPVRLNQIRPTVSTLEWNRVNFLFFFLLRTAFAISHFDILWYLVETFAQSNTVPSTMQLFLFFPLTLNLHCWRSCFIVCKVKVTLRLTVSQ